MARPPLIEATPETIEARTRGDDDHAQQAHEEVPDPADGVGGALAEDQAGESAEQHGAEHLPVELEIPDAVLVDVHRSLGAALFRRSLSRSFIRVYARARSPLQAVLRGDSIWRAPLPLSIRATARP